MLISAQVLWFWLIIKSNVPFKTMKLPNIYLICCKSEHATHKSNKNLKLGFTRPNHVSIMRSIVWRGGRVRSNAPDLKSGDGLNRPGVRIPPSPPYKASRYGNVSAFFIFVSWGRNENLGSTLLSGTIENSWRLAAKRWNTRTYFIIYLPLRH